MEVLGYVSLNEIVESIQRDLKLNEEIAIENVVSWAVEGLDLLGSPMAYIRKVCGESPYNPTIKIIDYKGKLPCDVYQIEHIRDACNKEALTTATDKYHLNTKNNQDYISCGNKYDVRDGYIYTNFEEGELEVSYLAYPIDKEGIPLIPDITRVKLAISSYIKYMIYQRKWLSEEVSEKQFRHMESEWIWRVGSGSTILKMPSKPQMQNIINRWVSLVPVMQEYMDSYRNTGEMETRYKF